MLKMEDARLLAGIMYRDERDYEKTRSALQGRYGGIMAETGAFPFDYTDYYEAEMGPSLMKRFLVFEAPFERGSLKDVKMAAMELEGELAKKGERRVNIDPGYMTLHNLVLATTKDFPHRVCLGQGIFAEVTMAFRKGGCEFFPWTYGDYREKGCPFFLGVREAMKKV